MNLILKSKADQVGTQKTFSDGSTWEKVAIGNWKRVKNEQKPKTKEEKDEEFRSEIKGIFRSIRGDSKLVFFSPKQLSTGYKAQTQHLAFRLKKDSSLKEKEVAKQNLESRDSVKNISKKVKERKRFVEAIIEQKIIEVNEVHKKVYGSGSTNEFISSFRNHIKNIILKKGSPSWPA